MKKSGISLMRSSCRRMSTRLLVDLLLAKRPLLAVLGQQPEDCDRLRGEGFEDGSTGGIRLEGGQSPIRARPGSRTPRQRADRGLRLYYGLPLCRVSPFCLRTKIQADGATMRRKRGSPVWDRCVPQQGSDGGEKVIIYLFELIGHCSFIETTYKDKTATGVIHNSTIGLVHRRHTVSKGSKSLWKNSDETILWNYRFTKLLQNAAGPRLIRLTVE